nr:mucin-2-like [Neodiprion pinetum]
MGDEAPPPAYVLRGWRRLEPFAEFIRFMPVWCPDLAREIRLAYIEAEEDDRTLRAAQAARGTVREMPEGVDQAVQTDPPSETVACPPCCCRCRYPNPTTDPSVTIPLISTASTFSTASTSSTEPQPSTVFTASPDSTRSSDSPDTTVPLHSSSSLTSSPEHSGMQEEESIRPPPANPRPRRTVRFAESGASRADTTRPRVSRAESPDFSFTPKVRVDEPPNAAVPPPAPSTSAPAPAPAVRDPRACCNCDEVGHLARQCTKPRRKFCYGCKQPGFTKAECPRCRAGWALDFLERYQVRPRKADSAHLTGPYQRREPKDPPP